MGSESADGVADQGWFEFYDDTIEADPSTDADRLFLAGLRARAVSHAWPCDPDDSWAYHAIEGDQHLLRVGVRLATWLTCGVEFDGRHIVGGETYNEVPFDFEGPTDAAMEFTGSVESLVERAAEWFEWLVSWPIELRQWFENGTNVSGHWVLADTEQRPLTNASRFPARPADRVTLVRGVRKPEADRSGGRRRWGFGKPRGK